MKVKSARSFPSERYPKLRRWRLVLVCGHKMNVWILKRPTKAKCLLCGERELNENPL